MQNWFLNINAKHKFQNKTYYPFVNLIVAVKYFCGVQSIMPSYDRNSYLLSIYDNNHEAKNISLTKIFHETATGIKTMMKPMTMHD